MMEWGDRGLKEGEDVLRALRDEGSTAYEMHKVMEPLGARFTGLLADALDIAIAQRDAAIEACEAARAMLEETVGMQVGNGHRVIKVDIETQMRVESRLRAAIRKARGEGEP